MSAAAQLFRLRPQRAADAPFLLELFADVRREEMDAANWPEAHRPAFLQDQLRLQTHYYQTHCTAPSFEIVELAGQPVGRLYSDEGGQDTRIVDISLLAAYRGRGLGTALLQRIIVRCNAAGSTVSLHVAFGNPAMRLYRRLGFRVIGPSNPTHIFMRYSEA
ncbi:MAG TPA: GNAT family N-acetyltransferase [Acidisoma sp.]|nr:GNAT family N-acetyltransferase [Acidisoma sp.]